MHTEEQAVYTCGILHLVSQLTDNEANAKLEHRRERQSYRVFHSVLRLREC